MRFDLSDSEPDHLLRWVQQGVVSRRQIEQLGGRESDVRRMVRRRELTAVHPGVYVNHTGELTRGQREWVAVHLGRTIAVPRFVVPHRTPRLDDLVGRRAGPPTLQLEHALINVMSVHVAKEDVAAAFAALTASGWSDPTGCPAPAGRPAAARPGRPPTRMSGTSHMAWYGLVFREQCQTALWIAEILLRHGWRGDFRRCRDCPAR